MRDDAVAADGGYRTERLRHLDADVEERLRELERERDRLEELLSVLSHDLRNHLAVANGETELAYREYGDERLETAVRAHERMGALLDDLLACRGEGFGVDEVETVSLADVAERCWRTVGGPGAELAVESDGRLRADPDRLAQLLENLLLNAVEHSSTGTRSRTPGGTVKHGSTSSHSQAREDAVTVRVGTLPDGFYVADDGEGLSDGERPTPSEDGVSTDDAEPGTGLYVVAAVAECHGWSVETTESAEGGARFEITGVERAPGQ